MSLIFKQNSVELNANEFDLVLCYTSVEVKMMQTVK